MDSVWKQRIGTDHPAWGDLEPEVLKNIVHFFCSEYAIGWNVRYISKPNWTHLHAVSVSTSRDGYVIYAVLTKTFLTFQCSKEIFQNSNEYLTHVLRELRDACPTFDSGSVG